VTPTASIAPVARPWLFRPVAPVAWDMLLWTSGGVALAGIALVTLVPQASELAVFFALTLLTNGPYSMFLPVAHEPILMVFARVYPPLLVAALGTVGATMVEAVNFRLYGALLHSDLLGQVRSSRWSRRVVEWFGVRPFLTVFICALTPIPFWIARACAALGRYPIHRHLLATAAGRMPRLWFYAAIATVAPISSGTLLLVGTAATVALGTLIVLNRRAVASTRGAVP
jgi:uncharacterized membrane protein YdjX (TVP38/TMEM64 family)